MLKVIAGPKAEPAPRDEMAKAAAPYLHSKLSAVEVDSKRGEAFKVVIEGRAVLL